MIPKFRAWDKETKSMNGMAEIYRNRNQEIELHARDESITLMQWTGLIDTNGKEIFEGDILKVTDGYSWLEVEYSWLEVVSFNEHKGMFVSKEIHKNTDILESPLWNLFITDLLQIEIIGNIYENPELLEVKQ